MTKRQSIIAGEREVAQRGENEREQDLLAAHPGDGGLELGRIDVRKGVHKIVSETAMMMTLAAMPNRRSAER